MAREIAGQKPCFWSARNPPLKGSKPGFHQELVGDRTGVCVGFKKLCVVGRKKSESLRKGNECG